MSKYSLVLVVLLVACAPESKDNSSPAPAPQGPSAGMICTLHNLSAPAKLPDFDNTTSSTVFGSKLPAGPAVATWRLAAALNFASAAELLADSGTSTSSNFGVRCKGNFDQKSGAISTLKLTSDDGSRLLVDGVEVINNDGTHGATTKSANVLLSPGTHELTVEHFNSGGPAMLKVESTTQILLYK